MRDDNSKKLQFPETIQPPQSGYSLPTDFVELPSKGKFYAEGHPLHNKEEIEVTFMTTKEEDILSSEAYGKKGIVFDKLIESLAIDKKIKASTLFLGDKNAIMINARKNAYGADYKIGIICEACIHENEITIDLEEVRSKELSHNKIEFTDKGTFILELPKTKAIVEIKLLTGEDEVEIQKKAAQKAKHNLPETPATDRLRQIITSVNGEFDMLVISSFISTLPISESRYIKKRYSELTPDIDFTYEFECKECDFVNKGGVPILGTFFWPDE